MNGLDRQLHDIQSKIHQPQTLARAADIMLEEITIQGARTHNLKNVSLRIPRNQFVVITGLSGSGKSSLAFDTLYAEGQRRYVESLSAYARQFLSLMEKPDVDHIDGLSPAISIEQKSTSHNPRSTVGTVTEIHDYLRLLFARVGQPQCPIHNVTLNAQTISQMTDEILQWPEGTKVMLLAPVVRDRKGEHLGLIDQLKAQGYIRVRIDGIVYEIEEAPKLDKKTKHNIEAVVDRFKVKPDITNRVAESLETCLQLSDGLAYAINMEAETENHVFSAKFACPHCGHTLTELEPRLFSFNNPAGACTDCDGLGMVDFFDPEKIIVDKTRTLAEGAIRDWHRNNPFHFQTLQSLANFYGFDLDTPFTELNTDIHDILFYGSGDTEIPLTFKNSRGQSVERKQPFEGIIRNIERRYNEAENASQQDELSQFRTRATCRSCNGSRLNESARHVFVASLNLPTVNNLAIGEALETLGTLELSGHRKEIADKILKEICARLKFLNDVGLTYLTLSRSADTLSGGEAQRIRLASQIGAGLVGVMYVLDEPSIGLHQRDNERLLKTLENLRDLGNTVIVVEHDEDAIRQADHLIDIGPGAGVHGGEVVAQGQLEDILQTPNSITGQFLSGKRQIKIPKRRRPFDKEKVIRITGATGNNLQNVTLTIPVGIMTCITGVSGSGKSTLINKTLYPLAAKQLNGATTLEPAPYEKATGLDALDKVVDIDQSPIGRTPRSNPATYTGIFTPLRELFANTQEARSRGYKAGRFSFNVKGGRCEACQGDGVIRVEMHFLADMYVVCDVCQGKRYNRETLEVRYKGKNIHEVLDMTVEEAAEFFSAIPAAANRLNMLLEVGLGYIKLGQAATTLSGGEAQRVKLAKELSRRDTGNTLYILDEPTTGLHFHDIHQLLGVLQALRERGNTIVVIEHNLDVIKTSDWIVDLGPEGGNQGGEIIAEGTPESLAKLECSHTGRFLQAMLKE